MEQDRARRQQDGNGPVAGRGSATALAGAALRALRSVRVAIVALAILATVSTLGTAIPRGRPPEFYAETYGHVLGTALRVSGFDDVYHSWWFVALLAWLLLSMSSCSLSRLRFLLRERSSAWASGDGSHAGQRQGRVAPHGGEGDAPSVPDTVGRAERWLRGRRYKVVRLEVDRGRYELKAEKGRAGRYGSLIIHTGAVVVLLGGALTGVFGVSRIVRVTEGETMTVPGTSLALRLHDFAIDYHPGSDRVKEYRSVASVLSRGREVAAGDVAVNHPLAAAGYRIYQMNYRSDVRDIVVGVERRSDGTDVGTYRLRLGQAQQVPGLGLRIEATAFEPDFVYHDGRAGSRSERFNNPAARLEVSGAGAEPEGTWIFEDSGDVPHGDGTGPAYRFRLAGYDARFVSGLKVVRDLGRPVVYVGFIVVIVGSFLGCYVFHRRLQVRVEDDGGDVRVSYFAHGTRNSIDFSREVEKFLLRLNVGPCGKCGQGGVDTRGVGEEGA